MNEIITPIIIFLAIFQLLFLIKLWGAANNIADIKNKMCNNNEEIYKVKIEAISGNPEKAQVLLNELFFNELSSSKYMTRGYAFLQAKNLHQSIANEVGLKELDYGIYSNLKD